METAALPTIGRQSSLDHHEAATVALQTCRRRRALILVLVIPRPRVGSQHTPIPALRVRRTRSTHRTIRCRVHEPITRRLAMDTRITDGVREIRGASVSSSLGTGATSARCIVTVFLSAVICREFIWRTSNRFHRG